MKIVGKIYLDSEGHVCIRWEDEVGKLVSEHGLQERAAIFILATSAITLEL